MSFLDGPTLITILVNWVLLVASSAEKTRGVNGMAHVWYVSRYETGLPRKQSENTKSTIFQGCVL